MKRIIIAAGLASASALACVVGVKAQGQSAPVFYSHIDYPAAGSTIKYGQFFVGHWAFECGTGTHPVFALPDIVNRDTNRRFAFDTFWQLDHLMRPDVHAVFGGICPALDVYSGVHTYVVPQPPPGRYRVRITWDDERGNVYGQTRDFTIVP